VEKTEILTKQKINAQTNQLPEPYNTIQYKHEGKILGKIVSIKNKHKKAIMHRTNLAKQTWAKTRKQLFTNPILNAKTKILLWNSLIRSTMTYALQTQEYTTKQLSKAEQFHFKRIRVINDTEWYQKTNKPTKQQLHQKHNQPAIKTWIQKLAITHHLRQTTNSWKIHTNEQPNAKKTRRNMERTLGNA